MGETLDEYIRKTYAADPVLAARFANQAYRLIHVSRRYWRGYKVMQSAEIRVDGVPVAAQAATKGRWKLMPDAMKDEFLSLERAVDAVLSMYCVSGSGGEADPAPVITGGGNYACPADNWGRVRHLLAAVQARWSETADRWCAEDGYDQLHADLKAQIGDHDYEKVKDLVPKRDALRGKFGLVVREVPVRIVEDKDVGGAVDDDRLAVFAELVAGSVRKPRLEAAEAMTALADQLVKPGAGGGLVPAYNRRSNKDGTVTEVGRAVSARAVMAARRAVDAVGRCGRAVDPAFREELAAVRAELPDAEDAARAVAVRLNADDAAAVALGKLLHGAATLAADESSMCDAVAEAIGGGRKGG